MLTSIAILFFLFSKINSGYNATVNNTTDLTGSTIYGTTIDGNIMAAGTVPANTTITTPVYNAPGTTNTTSNIASYSAYNGSIFQPNTTYYSPYTNGNYLGANYYSSGIASSYPSTNYYSSGVASSYPSTNYYSSGVASSYPSTNYYSSGIASSYPSTNYYSSGIASSYPNTNYYASGINSSSFGYLGSGTNFSFGSGVTGCNSSLGLGMGFSPYVGTSYGTLGAGSLYGAGVVLGTGLSSGVNFGTANYNTFANNTITGVTQGTKAILGPSGSVLGVSQPNQGVSKMTMDTIFPKNTSFLIDHYENLTIIVYCLRMKGDEEDSVTYEQSCVTSDNFDTYLDFCNKIKDLANDVREAVKNINFSNVLSSISQRLNPGDVYVSLFQETIQCVLWLRYWMNTKNDCYTTRVQSTQNTTQPQSALLVTQQLAKPFGQQAFVQQQVITQPQVLSTGTAQQASSFQTQANIANLSAQQILINLVKNKSYASLKDNVDIIGLLSQIFENLFGKINELISKESIAAGLSNTREDRRSNISVLASLFLDMPDIYQGICTGGGISVDVFKDIYKLTKTNVKDDKLLLSGREAILAAQVMCPNQGAYLDISKTDNNNPQRSSIFGIYANVDTPALVTDFLKNLNEARAFLLGGYESKVTELLDRGNNSQKVNALLSSAVGSLNQIIQNEGVANDTLGIRLVEDKGYYFKADTDMNNFMRAEHFLVLVWALAHWVLTNFSYGVNQKTVTSSNLIVTEFSDLNKKNLELLVSLCSSKNFFILNAYTSTACGILKVSQKTFFLDKVFAAIIEQCLKLFQSAFEQDTELRLWSMDLFLNMIKSTSSSKGPWPERIPDVFKDVKAQLGVLMQKKLMDHIDSDEAIPTSIGHSSNDSAILNKFVDIVTALKNKKWYSKAFDMQLRKNIDKKLSAVKMILAKAPPEASSTASSTGTQTTSSGTQTDLEQIPVTSISQQLLAL